MNTAYHTIICVVDWLGRERRIEEAATPFEDDNLLLFAERRQEVAL